ncbi:hypothetical protein [Arcobacter sp. CECT 8985]|uniref:hypothetical protein n=1 Tax=Arcobacter sp. CECT 8985 TaxID=1935424 RepID=UPI001024DA64|nr:hypothetical protein [Arcobacter sp. CECT 8985]RXJ86922.1 hypothetical protein CRU93_05955 [Arcobacter sp. CECT 8985]
MKLSEKIKLECFCAFVHSRMIGLDIEKDDDVSTDIIKDKKIVEDLYKKKDQFVSELAKIATLQSINQKIENSRSGMIAKMYSSNYTKLLNLIEKNIAAGQEYIPAFLGGCMLVTYFENDKNEEKINIKLDDLILVINHFETKSEDNKKTVLNMMKAAHIITEKYWSK